MGSVSGSALAPADMALEALGPDAVGAHAASAAAPAPAAASLRNSRRSIFRATSRLLGPPDPTGGRPRRDAIRRPDPLQVLLRGRPGMEVIFPRWRPDEPHPGRGRPYGAAPAPTRSARVPDHAVRRGRRARRNGTPLERQVARRERDHSAGRAERLGRAVR